jgi:hydroxyacylglutathione hydrolase
MVRIVPIPCLSDNYAYLIASDASRSALVVDPSEAEPVVDALARERLTLAGIACTHHHHDHVGGVADLLGRTPNVAVYAHESEPARIPWTTQPLADGAAFRFDDVTLRVLHVPGHTTGALAYVVDERIVFTGDTLFVSGCGRLFEGTAAMMSTSLARIVGLPDATEVYPGHEYAEKNLRFAATVDPGNADVTARLARVKSRRAAGTICVPSTVGEEKATNPFVRCDSDGVKAFAASRGAKPDDAVAVFAAVRSARDGF